MIKPSGGYKGLCLKVTQEAAQASGSLTWDAPVPAGEAPFTAYEVSWKIGPSAPLLDSSIDFIELYLPIFEPNTVLLLAELTRVLRLGGKLLVVFSESVEAKKEVLKFGSIHQLDAVSDDRSITLKKSSQLPAPSSNIIVKLTHREKGYSLLHGSGLEIGAFAEPAPVPQASKITYFDAIDTATARERFPEVDPAALVEVDVIGDVDRNGLSAFPQNSFDFVVCNHVIEHVANPVRLISALFDLLKVESHLVIAAPDKRFTFDHERELTSFAHLWDDFKAEVTANSDEHYIDFLKHVTPHLLTESVSNQKIFIEQCRTRREHAHVWDSASFQSFFIESLQRLGINAEPQFESLGDNNRIEYFGVWKKTGLTEKSAVVFRSV